MKRYVSLEDISDGKLYDIDDEFTIGCNNCEGCGECCYGKGDTIVLNPYDMYRLTKGLDSTFAELLDAHIELGVCDGLILPHMKLAGEDEHCTFLDINGRCSIHEYRSDICRLFPLGRIYENGWHKYFIQTHECRRVEGSERFTVRQWIAEPDYDRYEKFVDDWHDFVNTLLDIVTKSGRDEDVRNLSMVIIKKFYMSDYDDRDFYDQFYERLNYVKEAMGL